MEEVTACKSVQERMEGEQACKLGLAVVVAGHKFE
jgi:hypothetical protein